MTWVRNENDDIYDPSYTDMLRVAFTSEFKRGKLQDLVALLSGRNFETKQFEESIAESSFAGLKLGDKGFLSRDITVTAGHHPVSPEVSRNAGASRRGSGGAGEGGLP